MASQIDLSAGTIECEDTAGDGPAIVLLPGRVMDASLRDDVTADLSRDDRCVAPTLPLGAHRDAMCGGRRPGWGLARTPRPPRPARRHGGLVERPDSYTLIPLDQRARLADAIRQFTHEPYGAPQ